MTTKLEKATSATLVYQKLREDILRGTLVPGQKLAIEFVSERYQAGSNPVREALNRLSSEQLVDRHDQRGFFVPEISIATWRELVHTRCLLETAALRASMAGATPEWEEGIVVAFHRLSRCPLPGEDRNGDRRAEWEVLHRAFHRALLSNCGSRWLLRFCETLMDQAQRYIFISVLSARRSAIEEHRVLMNSVLDGDIEGSQKLLVEHYERTLHYVEQHIADAVACDDGMAQPR